MTRVRALKHIKSIGGGLLTWAGSAAVWAFDPEIMLSDQLRKEAVAPLCRALVLQAAEGAPEHIYQKALCLLYGLETQPQTPLALALLREAAAAAWVDAQLALGDTLQKGGNADQVEALRWYAMAMAAGDVRASSRHARLLQRRQALASPPDTDANTAGFGDGMPVNRDGYHCHISGLGKKFCHSAFD
ncbi:MAG: hypothetical protein CFE43_04385 [Burkholderiales bacterium PBB3]|nr:MAG: hypothetical protein CFE43_04385 [Burkholderiales bacterium PBB3]